MDFEAIVHLVLPVVTGQGARGEWTKQEVVFELPGEFNRKLCVGFWNDRANDAGALRPGDRVAVSINVESRERNGRWYTEARGWRMSRVGQSIQAPSYPSQSPYDAPAAAPTIQGEEAPVSTADDLPF